MSRFFTLLEAEESLPEVEKWLRAAIEAKDNVVTVEKDLQSLAARINLLGGMELDPSDLAAKRISKDQGIERLKEAMSKIEQSGCLLKDLDTGLIDFPAKLGAEEVYLCWRLGEPRIEYWHGVHEGFAGRKPIKSEFGGRKGSKRPN